MFYVFINIIFYVGAEILHYLPNNVHQLAYKNSWNLHHLPVLCKRVHRLNKHTDSQLHTTVKPLITSVIMHLAATYII